MFRVTHQTGTSECETEGPGLQVPAKCAHYTINTGDIDIPAQQQNTCYHFAGKFIRFWEGRKIFKKMKLRRALKPELSLSVICSRTGCSSRSLIVSNLPFRETLCAVFWFGELILCSLMWKRQDWYRIFLRGEK